MKKRSRCKYGVLKYLREHYADTKNSELAAKLGMTRGTISRIGRRYGLKKSPEIMKRWRAETCLKMRQLREAQGNVYALKAHRTLRERYGPHPGWSGVKGGPFSTMTPERVAEVKAKMRAARQASIARDRRRIALGLAPLGRQIAACPIDKKEVYRRAKMRAIGYITFRYDHVIYYDKDTRRCREKEDICLKEGLMVDNISNRG